MQRLFYSLAFLLVFSLAAMGSHSAEARQVVRIDTVYGDRSAEAGEFVSYRVRIRPGASTPVEYHWEFSDGARAEGITATRRFARAGRVRVLVRVRNRYGRDTDTFHVTVHPPAALADTVREQPAHTRPLTTSSTISGPPPPGSPAEPDRPDRASPKEGYRWVIASFLHREAAESAMRKYRKEGFRMALLVDASGSGSPAYRLVMGPYPSVSAALQARDDLPSERPGPPLLLSLREALGPTPGTKPSHSP